MPIDSSYNSLTVKVYQGLSTTLRPDLAKELLLIQDVQISTVFPYGLYGPASFFIPRDDLSRKWSFRAGDRVSIENGQTIVWEGVWGDTEITARSDMMGLLVNCNGGWGGLMDRQRLNKRWADSRLDEFKPTTNFELDKFDFSDNGDRLNVEPDDEVTYLSGDKIELGFYQMPTGETVKRMTFNYDLQETALISPYGAKYNNAPGGANTFDDMDEALDDDTSTFYTVTITSDDYLYIGTNKVYDETMFIRVDMGAVVNSNTASLVAEYSQGGGTWASLSITDGTLNGLATLGQDGDIDFTSPDDWDKERVDSRSCYWVRLSPSANLTANIRIKELRFGQDQAWKLALWNNTDSSDEWSVNSSGSGSADITFGVADDNPGFYFVSEANQTGIGNGSVYGRLSSIIVYSETGSITVNAVIIDVHGYANDLNSDTKFLSGNTLSIEPFTTEDYESLASIMERVIAYGDSSNNSWNVYLKHSEEAATPDGKPVLAIEQYPALTDYDYRIRIDDEILTGDISVVQDNSNIVNYVIVQYVNITNDDTEFITPDDNAALTDSDSVTEYGERHAVVDAGTADSTTALNFGKRYLAEHKDPKFYVNGPITVTGYIENKERQPVPAANIQAGKRIRVDNFLYDLSSASDSGLTAIITETQYNDNSQTCSMSLGIQNDAGLMMARSFTDLENISKRSFVL